MSKLKAALQLIETDDCVEVETLYNCKRNCPIYSRCQIKIVWNDGEQKQAAIRWLARYYPKIAMEYLL